MSSVIGLVVCGAGSTFDFVDGFIIPTRELGWRTYVTATPTAGRWLASSPEGARVEEVTGAPVRSQPRLPRERSPWPPFDCVVVAPASANTVAKLALGIADNQALTMVCEAVGMRGTPVVVFPRVNAAHVRHPAWPSHLDALRGAGVRLVMGPDVWPLHEPRRSGARRIPWPTIIAEVRSALTTG